MLNIIKVREEPQRLKKVNLVSLVFFKKNI
jgi:hypothetical protein